jgi:hypothetical protein
MEIVIVAIINLVGVIITSAITNITQKKVSKVDEMKMEQYKIYLTDFLSELEVGEKKTEIQIKMAYEIYEKYTALHGNSFIHAKWDELQTSGKL